MATTNAAGDATLSMPRLIIPSIEVSMRAGEFPLADRSGKHFIKVPVNVCCKRNLVQLTPTKVGSSAAPISRLPTH